MKITHDKPKKLTLTPERMKELKRTGSIKAKPVRHSVAIESRYIAALMRLTNQMIAQTQRDISRILKVSASDDAKEDREKLKAENAAKLKAAQKAVKNHGRDFSAMFKRKSADLAKNMITAVSTESSIALGKSLKDASGDMTLKMDFINQPVGDVIREGIMENINRISSIPEEYMSRVSTVLERSAMRGGDLTGVVEKLQKVGGMSQRAAKNIALDQTRKAYSTINQARMKEVGVEKYEWVHSGGGAHPREKHITPFSEGGLNGGIFEIENPPNAAEEGEPPYYANPAEMINCFPYWSNVSLVDSCHKLFRRIYFGKTSEIVTDNGTTLDATPNHPILTSAGWKAAHEIEVGDYLVSGKLKGSLASEADVQNSVIAIGKLFDAMASVFGIDSPNASSVLQFHGDVSGNNVDIVSTAGYLPKWIKPCIAQQVVNEFLSVSDKCAGFCSSDCSSFQIILGSSGTPERIISGLCPVLSALKSSAVGAYDAGLRLVSDLNALLDQARPDCAPCNANHFADFKLAHAADIHPADFAIRQILSLCATAFDSGYGESFGADKLGQIIGIASDDLSDLAEAIPFSEKFERVIQNAIVEKFSGHVYNLQNEKNWYLSEGIISHNCKCVMAPVIEFDDSDEEDADAEEEVDSDEVDAEEVDAEAEAEAAQPATFADLEEEMASPKESTGRIPAARISASRIAKRGKP